MPIIWLGLLIVAFVTMMVLFVFFSNTSESAFSFITDTLFGWFKR